MLIQGEKDFSTGPRIMNFSAPELEDFAGATRTFASIARMVLWEGARLAAVGTVVGVAGAYAASGVLSTFVYGVTTTDIASFGAAAIALLAVALLASYLPARRAARVDPMTALRTE